MALVGVGPSTRLASLRQVGPAPFLMGLAVAVMLALVILGLLRALGLDWIPRRGRAPARPTVGLAQAR